MGQETREETDFIQPVRAVPPKIVAETPTVFQVAVLTTVVRLPGFQPEWSFKLSAPSTNTGVVYIRFDDGLVAPSGTKPGNGFSISPGGAEEILVKDSRLVFCIGTAGDFLTGLVQ